jgi:hypothetical protein
VIAKLGVGLGDKLIRFNGVEIRSANQLATLVGVLPASSWVTMVYAPHLPDGGFADEREIAFRVSRLDTGSSRGPLRLATDEQRSTSRRALSRQIGAGEDTVAGATMVLEGPAGETIGIHRLGDKLRWSDGALVLVRTAAGEGFKIDGGQVSGTTPDEQSKLEREFLLNSFLWKGEDRRSRIAEATLEGGLLVQGRAAYRFRVPGPSEFEVFYYPDGSPAGYRYRDQLRRRLLDVMISGESVWFVEERDTLVVGFRVAELSYDPLPAAELFSKPSR